MEMFITQKISEACVITFISERFYIFLIAFAYRCDKVMIVY